VTNAASGDDVWHKSSASQPGGDCLEVALAVDAVRIRDSQDRSGAVLSFTHAEWRAFLDGARDGEFNLPDA
jgi:hypothetical protein